MREARATSRGGAPRSIRRHLTRIVLIPSLSFLVLWLVMSIATTTDASRLLQSAVTSRDGAASFGAIGAELREERRASQVFLADASETNRTILTDRHGQTDTTLAAVREQAWSLTERGDQEIRSGAAEFFDHLAELSELRTEIENQTIGRPEALERYTELLEALHHVFDATSGTLADHESLAEGILAGDLLRARDQFAQADALLAGALAAEAITYAETAHFTYLTASYRERLRIATDKAAPGTHGHHETMVDGAAWATVANLSGEVVMREPAAGPGAADSPVPDWEEDVDVTATQWRAANDALAEEFHDLTTEQVRLATESAWSAAVRTLVVNLGGSMLALLAGAVAIVVAIRSSSHLSRRLYRLRAEVMQQVEDRLPKLMSHAQRGKRVDINAELPSLRNSPDELGEVADAFCAAQRTAIGAAVKQAEFSEGASRVFQSIAYRNQALIRRQLALLAEVRAEVESSRVLDKLTQVDHLATRGRRYADNLIILSGAGNVRRWRTPLALVEVLNTAIAETEDYQRVRVCSAPELLLRGPAVGDVLHLLAELIENATQFSPASATVDVTAGPVADGLAVEVEDRGLGMSHDDYAATNVTIANPPEFDVMALSEEPRLGVFVVARLAARQGIRVRLSPSPYGGTRAVILLPGSLLAEAHNVCVQETDPAMTVEDSLDKAWRPDVQTNTGAPRLSIQPSSRTGEST